MGEVSSRSDTVKKGRALPSTAPRNHVWMEVMASFTSHRQSLPRRQSRESLPRRGSLPPPCKIHPAMGCGGGDDDDDDDDRR